VSWRWLAVLVKGWQAALVGSLKTMNIRIWKPVGRSFYIWRKFLSALK
jgi:hypothetical protein